MAHIMVADWLLSKGYLLGKLLGKGENGTVYILDDVNANPLPLVVKIKNNVTNEYVQYSFSREIKNQELLASLQDMWTPKVYDYDVVAGFGIIIMSKIDGTILSFFKERVRSEKEVGFIMSLIYDLILRLHRMSFCHGDFHWENLGYQVVNGEFKISLLDFGWSFNERSCTVLEVAQLIRCMYLESDDSSIFRKNAKMIKPYLHEIAAALGWKRNLTFEEAQKVYEKLHYDLRKEKKQKYIDMVRGS